jgi:hypothetical protein
MSNDEHRRLQRRLKNSLTVATFLGGFTLASLSFILPLQIHIPPITFFSNTIDYKQLLILFVGVASAALITSVYGIKAAIVRETKEFDLFTKLAVYSYEAGYLAILVLLPLLVAPFSVWSSILILIVEFLWLIIWGVDQVRRQRKKR